MMKFGAPSNEQLAADDTVARGEWLSALFDGECPAAQVQVVLGQGDRGADALTWNAYRCIGDALRAQSSAVRSDADAAFVRAVMARVAREPVPTVSRRAPALAAPTAAANDDVFRWKMVAGLAAVAAVVAIAWQMGAVPGAPDAAQETASMAQASVPQAVAAGAVSSPASAMGALARDPQLAELIAAHHQWGGASALQTSAGFLRAASYAVPAR